MNVTKQASKAQFTPYTISIEVESKEDEVMLAAIAALDCTIPDEAFPENEYMHAKVEAFLSQLQGLGL